LSIIYAALALNVHIQPSEGHTLHDASQRIEHCLRCKVLRGY